MRLFKLTDGNGCTKNDTQWGAGVNHSVVEEDRRAVLCSPGVLHAYTNATLGLLLNPIHANLNQGSLQLWKAEGEDVVSDWGKVGCFELTTTHRVDLPEWYSDDELLLKVVVRFARLCAADATVNANANPYAAASAASAAAGAANAYAAEAERYAANAAHGHAAEAAAYAATACANAYAYASSAADYDSSAYAYTASDRYASEAGARLAALAERAVGEVMPSDERRRS